MTQVSVPPTTCTTALEQQRAWFDALCDAESIAFGDAATTSAAFAMFQERLRAFEPLACLPGTLDLIDVPASSVFEDQACKSAKDEGLVRQPPRSSTAVRSLPAFPSMFVMPKPSAGGLHTETVQPFMWDVPQPSAARWAHDAEQRMETLSVKAWNEHEMFIAHTKRLRDCPSDEALATAALQHGVTWVAESVRTGRLDREELAEHFRRRARRLDPFVQAREVELGCSTVGVGKSMNKGPETGSPISSSVSLIGVPVAVKSLFWVEGQTITAGSKMLARFVAPEDASMVAALRVAGADLACLVKTDEFAMGSRGTTCAWGATRHPLIEGASPGGSSSGSAAAVASGMAMMALGSDTGGSIRLPASYGGLWGLKPTRGELSRHGMVAYAFSLDTPGLITRSAGDLSLGFEAMSHGAQWGADAACHAWDRRGLHDRCSQDVRVRLLHTQPLDGLRVGIPSYCLRASVLDLHPEIRACLSGLSDRLEVLGAQVSVVEMTDPSLTLLSYYVIAATEALSSLARMDPLRLGYPLQGSGSWEEAFTSGRTALIGHEARLRILTGAHVLAQSSREALYAKALGLRRNVVERHAQAFEHVDLLLSPTAPGRAPSLYGVLDVAQEWAADALTIPASLAGVCALSAPWGQFTDGQPMGFQLTTAWHAEERLLKWARVIDQALYPENQGGCQSSIR